MVAWGFSGGGEAPRGRGRPEYEAYRSEPPELVGLGRLGSLKDNRDVRVGRENPEADHIDTKVFDFFWEKIQKAVSVKTLDTLRIGYIKDPRTVYYTIKQYVDDVASYDKPRAGYDLNPRLIKQRELQLGVPEASSPEQIQQVVRAWTYARERDVNLVVTRIRND